MVGLCTLCAIPTLAHAGPGELTPIPINAQGNNFGYFEYLPNDYNESVDWPVLIFLSGIGEFGTGELPPEGACINGPNYNEPVLCRNLRHGPQRLIYDQLENGQTGNWNDVERPFIVIAPQNNAELFTYTPYSATAMEQFVDYLVDAYAVDEGRIYLTGMSMGGYSVTLAANEMPDRFAAIATMPGINGIPLENTCNVTHNALWVFHGEDDGGTFSPNGMVRLGNDYNLCENPHPVGRITVYENAGHDVWTRTIDPRRGMDDSTLDQFTLSNGTVVDLDPYDISLYDWLLQYDKPIVDLGPDFTTGEHSLILASPVDDDDAVSYVWTQVAGPVVDMQGLDTDTLTLPDLPDGEYGFQLDVLDSDGMTGVDAVAITVIDGYVPPPPEPEPEVIVPPPPVPAGCFSVANDPTDLASLSDDFDDTTQLACWNALDVRDDSGVPLAETNIAIDSTIPGALAIEPLVTGGWFDDFRGPFLYKDVTGDFMLEVSVSVEAGDGGWPADPFNSAGILARTPSIDIEDHVLWNVGNQFSVPGTEGKITEGSVSDLTLTNLPGSLAEPTPIQLRMCRLGDTFVLADRFPGETSFSVVHEFLHASMPDTVQVGPAMTSWNGTSGIPNTAVTPDVTAIWNYARFSPIENAADCVVALPSCDDGILNQDETDIDCGGSCGPCADGLACFADIDCASSPCEDGFCGGIVETCDDGILNQGEEGIDCGGPCAAACPTCDDGVQNQDEEGIDCGGSCEAACPSCFDGIQNQGELDVDCGGPCVSCDSNDSLIVTTDVFSNWGTGYCARFYIQNVAAEPSQSWEVVLDVGDAQTTSTWGSTYSASTGTITVTSTDLNGTLVQGQSRNFGHCALSPSGTLPTVVFVDGEY